MAVSVLFLSSAFVIEGATGVLLYYIGYTDSTPVYTDGPYWDTKQTKPPYVHLYSTVGGNN